MEKEEVIRKLEAMLDGVDQDNLRLRDELEQARKENR